MSLLGRAVLPGLFAALVMGAASVAAADPIPSPVIAVGTADVDPTKYDWLSDEARKTLTDAIQQLKSGSIVAMVFAGAPGGNFWSYRTATKPTDSFNIADLARQALQACAYFSNTSCYIVSINGKEARDASGGLPDQPWLFSDAPALFDASLVPFVTMDDHNLLRAYSSETKPKVLVITPAGGWLWRTGDTLFSATATGLTDCQKANPNSTCLLYAVNDRVVFHLGGPY